MTIRLEDIADAIREDVVVRHNLSLERLQLIDCICGLLAVVGRATCGKMHGINTPCHPDKRVENALGGLHRGDLLKEVLERYDHLKPRTL